MFTFARKTSVASGPHTIAGCNFLTLSVVKFNPPCRARCTVRILNFSHATRLGAPYFVNKFKFTTNSETLTPASCWKLNSNLAVSFFFCLNLVNLTKLYMVWRVMHSVAISSLGKQINTYVSVN